MLHPLTEAIARSIYMNTYICILKLFVDANTYQEQLKAIKFVNTIEFLDLTQTTSANGETID